MQASYYSDLALPNSSYASTSQLSSQNGNWVCCPLASPGLDFVWIIQPLVLRNQLDQLSRVSVALLSETLKKSPEQIRPFKIWNESWKKLFSNEHSQFSFAAPPFPCWSGKIREILIT